MTTQSPRRDEETKVWFARSTAVCQDVSNTAIAQKRQGATSGSQRRRVVRLRQQDCGFHNCLLLSVIRERDAATTRREWA
jgi:hypothetical protein